MKKFLNYIFIAVLGLASMKTNAQDLITKKDGSDINAKVLEISSKEIKYKKSDNPSGPIYTLHKSDILMIRYENGTKDIFNETVTTDNKSKDTKESKKDEIIIKDEKNYFNKGTHEMIIGEKINTYHKNKNKTIYYQDKNKLHYVKMFRSLKEVEACSENMELAKKYRTRAIIFVTVGTLTMPLGYLIMVAPLLSSKKKENKYFVAAIEDYNESLK